MARSTPTSASGTIVPKWLDGDVTADLMDEVRTQMGSFQSNGGNAWEEYDVINATSPNLEIVFRSLGDRTLVSGAGDAGIFVKVHQTDQNSIEFIMYQDWSTNASGSGARASSTTQAKVDFQNFEEIRWWRVSNEYETAFVFMQDGNTAIIWFGNPERTHVPAAANGVAFTQNAETTTGSDVVIELDRDISSSIVASGDPNGPQKVWIYNQTAAGNALESDTVQILDVSAVSATTITLNITANLAAGAIVGLDPSFACVAHAQNTGNPTLYGINKRDGTYSASANNSSWEQLGALYNATNNNPGVDGLYHGSKAIVNMTTAPAGPRGTIELIGFFPSGNQVTRDGMLPNFATANRYRMFRQLTHETHYIGIGPGA